MAFSIKFNEEKNQLLKVTRGISFEDVQDAIEKGNLLADILLEKEKSGYFKDSIRNFYTIKRKGFNRHSVIKESFNLLSNQAKDIFFKNKIGLPK